MGNETPPSLFHGCPCPAGSGTAGLGTGTCWGSCQSVDHKAQHQGSARRGPPRKKPHLATVRGERSRVEGMVARPGTGLLPGSHFHPQKRTRWLLRPAPAPALQPAPTWPPRASFLPALGTTLSPVVNFIHTVLHFSFFPINPLVFRHASKKSPMDSKH